MCQGDSWWILIRRELPPLHPKNRDDNSTQLSDVHCMRIPHTQLTSAALRAVIKEFVTRDGRECSSIERHIETILSQLIAGDAELHFDEETQACAVVSVP
jgi:uncharacterized protein